MGGSIDVEEKDSIVFLRMTEEELGPQQAAELKNMVRVWSEKKARAFIINFFLVEYMSSIFLSALIEILKELQPAKIKLALTDLSQKNLDIIKTTKLDSVFSIFGSSYEAAAAFENKKIG